MYFYYIHVTSSLYQIDIKNQDICKKNIKKFRDTTEGMKMKLKSIIISLNEDITKILYVFIFSVLGFYSIDIKTNVYLIVAITIWIILFVNYRKDGNMHFYIGAIIISLCNIMTFALMKYIDGYRFTRDLEDVFCTVYIGCLLVGMGFCYTVFLKEKKKQSDTEEKDRKIFLKRKDDLKRLIRYLEDANIVGIQGSWGSGKTFLVEELLKDENINKKYTFIKIDLLSCNLDSIETRLINELETVLSKNRIYSVNSTKLKKILGNDSILNNIGQVIGRECESYSEILDDFKRELNLVDETIVVIYEDIDRINNEEIIKKIFDISEKLSSKKIKIIYEYDEHNLKNVSQEFNRDYLEKYIPLIVQLTSLDFFDVLARCLEENKVQKNILEIKDFQYLNRRLHMNFIAKELLLEREFQLEITNISIRKVERFLEELVIALKEKEIYRSNKQDVITFFLIKHFFYSIYEQFYEEYSLIKNFRFKYEQKEYTIIELMDIVQAYKEEGAEEEAKKFIQKILDLENNKNMLCLFVLFGYECDVDRRVESVRDILNAPFENIKKKNRNEQKERLFCNLICSGKSEYTDQESVLELFKDIVMKKSKEKRIEAYQDFMNKIYHGEFGKRDNNTIFYLGVPSFLSLFQAYYVVGASESEWIDFIDFYLQYEKVDKIDLEYIENLNYCDLQYKKVYLYILENFCSLEIIGNMNEHISYRRFLRKYLGALSSLGVMDTHELQYLDNGECITSEYFINNVFKHMEEKLKKIKDEMCLEIIKDEINIIIKFIHKNLEIIKKTNRKPEKKIQVTFGEPRIVLSNQEEFDRLRKISEKDKEEYKRAVEESYKNGNITVYEIRKLPKIE